jgi:hypothetical protein
MSQVWPEGWKKENWVTALSREGFQIWIPRSVEETLPASFCAEVQRVYPEGKRCQNCPAQDYCVKVMNEEVDYPKVLAWIYAWARTLKVKLPSAV